jgi:hypothetical protein
MSMIEITKGNTSWSARSKTVLSENLRLQKLKRSSSEGPSRSITMAFYGQSQDVHRVIHNRIQCRTNEQKGFQHLQRVPELALQKTKRKYFIDSSFILQLRMLGFG